MGVGFLTLGVAFVVAVVAAISFLRYFQTKKASQLGLAISSYYVLFLSLLFATGLLLAQILTHNFQVNYVYSYSSKSLPLFYLISAFWAGQEGTFLLWLFFSTVIGLFLLRRHSKENPLALFFLLLVNIFILIILIKKSPFTWIWQIHKEVAVGFQSTDGAGLNPLLQNPWMVIHPPILFLGYAATVVPFAFALSAMIRKDFLNWVKVVRPWVIFIVLVLGSGIMLGAYWAYTTLGWGGYWGWDPVENSSLVPWLLSVALLHGVIIQIKQKGLVRTNLFLAGLSFVTVLWGTFLTRSGVLTDFSVHSFGESGLNTYLMAFVLLAAAGFLLLFFRSNRAMKSPHFTDGILSRETFILVGILTLLFSAIFTFIGTSSPLFTGLFGKASNVSTGFYNTVHIPIVIFLLFSMALSPLLIWNVAELKQRSTFFSGLASAVVATVAAVFFGLTQLLSIVLFFLAAAVTIIQAIVLFRRARAKLISIGSYLTHIGIALMIIGIITSSLYDTSEKMTLPLGEFEKTALGYELKFTGFKEMPDGKNRAQLEIKTGEKIISAEAQFYFSEYTKSYMVSPFVKVGLFKDIYLSPISFIPAEQSNQQEVVLRKGETKSVNNLNITFHGFEVGQHDMMSAMVVKANLTVQPQSASSASNISLKPEYLVQDGNVSSPAVQIPNQPLSIKIISLNASDGTVKLSVVASEGNVGIAKDMLGVELSTKPLISLLWFGTMLAIGGVLLSWFYRSKRSS